MRIAYSVGICALLVTAVAANAQEYLREQTKREIAALKSEIGKKFWVSANQYQQQLCKHSTYVATEKCTPLKRGSWFVVKDLVVSGGFPEHDPVLYTWRFFKVLTEDNRSGYVQVISREALLREDPVTTAQRNAERRQAAIDDCNRRGQPKIGMSKSDAVETCWGKPANVRKLTTASGMQEDFDYGHGRVLRFENGTLAAILEVE